MRHSITRLSSPLTPLVLAAASMANVVKSSLGPVGMDKMMVNEIGVSNNTGEGCGEGWKKGSTNSTF